ncbi:MAG TPA: CcoQ/FixQ family Cbb3-type cytochrome c oxidase assembly chaperone [Oxalobacteraceae bacterium]|jgi:cytochrome c oxidase cbb3-type subunit 4|nr:CcoQ/FixQ family Cbb3-type cytochrome c oxidase assembly chaperone [Oxalobacteraceae bacterium]HCN89995.1 CcoQ/FixQ family Cbb3-type cytochrome c oxidase assembly chaperone [Oxalobacteraceae bacterium]
MAISSIFTDASSAMTVISLVTFLGILWWTFGARRKSDFDAASRLPFADDFADAVAQQALQEIPQDSEKHHG